MEKITYEGQELLPITSDIVFKALFGSEDNKELLVSLLNSFIDIDIKSQDQIKILTTELMKKHKDDKLSRLDIRIEINDSEHIDVEVQVQDKKDMIKRSIFYAAKLYTEQMEESKQYKEISRTIALNILCYTLFTDDESYISSYRLKNVKTNKELTDIIEIDFVELPKVKKRHSDQTKDLWAIFLSAKSEEELKMLAQKNETIHKAIDNLKYMSSDKNLRFQYEQREKARLDYNSDMAGKLEEGIEIGIKRGIERGIEQGIEQGIEESNKQTARKLLKENLPIKLIIKITGLTEEAIHRLE